MSWSHRSTAARIVSSSRSASMMIMTSYGRVMRRYLLRPARSGRSGPGCPPDDRRRGGRIRFYENRWKLADHLDSTYPKRRYKRGVTSTPASSYTRKFVHPHVRARRHAAQEPRGPGADDEAVGCSSAYRYGALLAYCGQVSSDPSGQGVIRTRSTGTPSAEKNVTSRGVGVSAIV